MKQNTSMAIVREIMTEFSDLTGLSSSGKAPRRYLWTDAFAVCNFIELYHQTGDLKYKHLTLQLVDQVHNILGRHREDDQRKGWISGLDEKEGRVHPTRGGLRIGKKLNERGPADPFDERLEWDRDGQYYHYLTKWMHALNRMNQGTGDSTYNMWAIELAKTAHAMFTYVPASGGQKRMYWKMSIDLSYPLVQSMGHLDPIDGFIIYNELQATAAKYSEKSAWPNLKEEIADMANICEGKNWGTDDPLGIGELLCDAYKVMQLILHEHFAQIGLLEILLDSALQGLKFFAIQNPLNLPADYRLAFRELGLSIGLQAVKRLWEIIRQNPDLFPKKHPLYSLIETLMRYVSLSETIEKSWLEGKNQKANSWTAHRDINMVMLATSLSPDGYLSI
jgi:hypothetical protein